MISKEHNSHVCEDQRFSVYEKYWRTLPRDEILYLKDWHFHRDTKHNYSAYTTPSFFTSDWLNEWWESRTDKNNDYRFVYIGPKNSWTPLHADVFGSFSWSANIVGRKQWTFLLPGEEEKIRDALGNLPFNLTSEDLGDKDIKCVEVYQEVGEIIFVPSGWFHQVRNTEDTISINHNWFNGCNIMFVVQALTAELRKVEREIGDCRVPGNVIEWRELCQDLLRQSYGMNLHDLLILLEFVLQRRLKILESQTTFLVFEDYSLGPNHAKFDIQKIEEATKFLLSEFKSLELEDYVSKCEEILVLCQI